MVVNKEKDGKLGDSSDSLKHETWEMGSSRPVLWRWELSEGETVWFRPKQDWKGPDDVMPEGWLEETEQSVGASADPSWQLQLHVRPARGDLNHTSAPAPPKSSGFRLQVEQASVCFLKKYPRWFCYARKAEDTHSRVKWDSRASLQPWPWSLCQEKADFPCVPWGGHTLTS